MINAKWDFASKCNLRCKHCSVADMYFANKSMRSLSIEDKLCIVDRLAKGGVVNISILGGEPLTLSTELYAVIDHARKHGIRVTVVTNGTLLDKNVAQKLIECGLHRLVVSIDGPTAEPHESIRGKGTFEIVVRNIKTFLSMRTDGCSPLVGVNTVLCKPNRVSFSQMIPFCQELGVDSWSALTLNFIGNAKKGIDSLTVTDAEHTEVAIEIGQLLSSRNFDIEKLDINFTLVYPLVWEYICKKFGLTLPQPKICCDASTSLIYISPSGEVHLCDRVNNSGYSGLRLKNETIHPVNLLEHTLESIWKSEQSVEMYDVVHQPKTYAGYEPCMRCKYLFDKTCTPCPLYSYNGGRIVFSECMKAESYLKNDRNYKPTNKEISNSSFTELEVSNLDMSAYDELSATYPQYVFGVRSSLQPSGNMLLMQPETFRSIKINQFGSFIWGLIDGQKTTENIVSDTVNACVEAYHLASKSQDSVGVDKEEYIINNISTDTIKFILTMKDMQYLTFTQDCKS